MNRWKRKEIALNNKGDVYHIHDDHDRDMVIMTATIMVRVVMITFRIVALMLMIKVMTMLIVGGIS